MKQIYKHTIVVTVLSEHSCTLAAFGDDWSLHDVADAITSGDSIGSVIHESTATVDPQDTKNELLAIGNDGTFFDDLDTLNDCDT